MLTAPLDLAQQANTITSWTILGNGLAVHLDDMGQLFTRNPSGSVVVFQGVTSTEFDRLLDCIDPVAMLHDLEATPGDDRGRDFDVIG